MTYDFATLTPKTAAILNTYLLGLVEHELTYNILARLLRLPRVRADNWHYHPLNRVFKELDSEDKRNGRPLRTVIVVRYDTERPGNGFHNSLFDLKSIDGLSEAEKFRAYKRELSRAIAYAKDSIKTLSVECNS